MLNQLENKDYEIFIADDDNRNFLQKWYRAYSNDRLLKNRPYRCLGNTALDKFWQVSRDNYDVIIPLKSKSDWKRTAKRTITRDKANGFIGKLTRRLIYPQIFAQNKNQQIDNDASRILKIILEWWERRAKALRIFIDAVTTCVIEGTVHVQQHVINGREEREIVENDEIFVPNFKQADIQKQSHLIRAHITSYEEAKMIFGDNDNWKHVLPGGADNWGIKGQLFKDYDLGMIEEDEVLVIYCWEHTGYDNKGKPKAKLFNVLISGVPMYATDNTQNLKHNLYPISKTIFERFSRLFYWGNSLPNKVRHDQAFLDAFRTILLNKAILNLLPTLLNKSGEYVDESSIYPGNIITTQMAKGDIFKIEGIGDPVTQGDIAVEQLVKSDIDDGTAAPVSLGSEGAGGRTLGEIQLQVAKSQEILEIFGKMVAFLVEDMAEQSLSNICQFEIKKNIDKLVDNNEILFKKALEIPKQRLSSGDIGTMALNFVPPEQHPSSMDIAKEEFKAKESGNPKEIIYIDPSYLDELDKLIYVSANPVEKPSNAMEQLLTTERYKTVYLNNPNIDQKEATRMVIEANGDDESRLLVKEQLPPEMAGLGQQLAPGRMASPTTRAKQSLLPKQNLASQMV
jgi:hypothetical protein